MHNTMCWCVCFEFQAKIPCFKFQTCILMPYCTTCGVRFRGQGVDCGLHYDYHNNQTSSGTYDQYNYSSESTNPGRARSRTRGNRRRLGTLRFGEAHDIYAHYDDHNAVVRYNTNGNAHRPSLASVALAQPLVQVFSTLADTHAISSVKYSVSPLTGTHSLTAEANFEREQCAVCQHWFPDVDKLRHHHKEFSIGCDECRVCLRPEDIWWHSQRMRHERCFVRGCDSVYRREGDWKAGVVERHVRQCHF
jgi:hypothetical protein